LVILAGLFESWGDSIQGAVIRLVCLVILPGMIASLAIQLRLPSRSEYWLPMAMIAMVLRSLYVVVVATLLLWSGGWERFGMARPDLPRFYLWLAAAYCLYLTWETILLWRYLMDSQAGQET